VQSTQQSVVKPTIENGFDYKRLHWADLPLPPADEAGDATLVPQAPKRRARRSAMAWS